MASLLTRHGGTMDSLAPLTLLVLLLLMLRFA
jgi:hypothetical protein